MYISIVYIKPEWESVRQSESVRVTDRVRESRKEKELEGDRVREESGRLRQRVIPSEKIVCEVMVSVLFRVYLKINFVYRLLVYIQILTHYFYQLTVQYIYT
jgi:hypothetical protein